MEESSSLNACLRVTCWAIIFSFAGFTEGFDLTDVCEPVTEHGLVAGLTEETGLNATTKDLVDN